MKFTTLNQTKFKTHNGDDIGADEVEFIAPYKHIADGFYEWECGSCANNHSQRSCGWSISGQVMECRKCHKMSLLVKTNIDELNKWMGAGLNLEQLKEQADRLQKEIARYIPLSQLDELLKHQAAFQKVQKDYDAALRTWNMAMNNYQLPASAGPNSSSDESTVDGTLSAFTTIASKFNPYHDPDKG